MFARLYHYSLSMRSSIREGLVLETETGWGEIAPMEATSLIAAEAEILTLLPFLARGEPVAPIHPAVRFGIASAARPLPSKPFSVPIAALILGSGLVAQAEQAAKEGFQVLKIKLSGIPIDQAISLIKEMPPLPLRIDCNQSWSFAEAMKFASSFSPERFAYLEEPLRDPCELPRFARETGLQIAVDESYNPDTPFLRVVKPTRVGYASPGAILSSFYESNLGLLKIAELADVMPVGLDTGKFFQENLLDLPVYQGHLHWEPNRIRTERLLLKAAEFYTARG
jgi:O-succinylbenzoate synthase